MISFIPFLKFGSKEFCMLWVDIWLIAYFAEVPFSKLTISRTMTWWYFFVHVTLFKKKKKKGWGNKKWERKSNPLGHLYSRAKCVSNFCKNISYQENEQTTPHIHKICSCNMSPISHFYLVSLIFCVLAVKKIKSAYINIYTMRIKFTAFLRYWTKSRFNFLRHIWERAKREGRRLRSIVTTCLNSS